MIHNCTNSRTATQGAVMSNHHICSMTRDFLDDVAREACLYKVRDPRMPHAMRSARILGPCILAEFLVWPVHIVDVPSLRVGRRDEALVVRQGILKRPKFSQHCGWKWLMPLACLRLPKMHSAVLPVDTLPLHHEDFAVSLACPEPNHHEQVKHAILADLPCR